MRKKKSKVLTRRGRLLAPGDIGRMVGCGSIGLFLLLAFILINPSAESHSYATCMDGIGSGECAVSALSQEVGVTTKTVITLATTSQVKLPDVTPTSAGVTSYASTKLAVSTNSKEGYSIFLQAGTADGSLVGVTSGMDDTSKITNTSKTGVTLSNLETDSYGYTLSATPVSNSSTYSHVPTSNTVIYNKPSNAAMGAGNGDYPYGDEYYLGFGTKIGTSLPAGTYAGTVTVSAVANPITVTSLYDISTMQQMTSSICENTKEHYTKQLVDERDGKSYWVAKLKDGNCWMVQNLALDLSTSKTLTPANSDVSQDWAPKQNTNVSRLNGAYIWSDIGSNTRSWSFGKMVLLFPASYSGCSSYNEASGLTSPTETCVHVVDVSSDDWSPTFVAQQETVTRNDFVRKTVTNSEGATVYSYIPRAKAEELSADKDANGNYISFTKTGYAAVDFETKTYDAHYLVGNYYQFSTVTAETGNSGTGSSEIIANASNSICPKGWKLPMTTSRFNSDSGSREYLLKQYNGNLWTSGDGKGAKLAQAPFYYVAGGLIFMDNGYLDTLGSIVYYSNATMKNTSSYLSAVSEAWVGLAYGPYANNIAPTTRCVAK